MKECPVIMRNSAVMVVKYGNTEVQLPTDNSADKTIFVDKQGDKYTQVSKGDYIKSTTKPKEISQPYIKGDKETKDKAIKS